MKKNKEKGEGKGKKGGREKKAEKKKELICWFWLRQETKQTLSGGKMSHFSPKGKEGRKKGKS